MNKIILTAIMALAVSAHASSYTTGTIPDGNPAGVTFTGTYDEAAIDSTISSLTITLNLSGGYNGDLYSYLVAPDGTIVTLMDRPGVGVNGFGAGGAGMNITLQDDGAANGNIQNETSDLVLSGTYNADQNLSGFNGSVADGSWTLYFADLAVGGGTSTLNSWALDVTTAPEPANIALAIAGGLLVIACRFKRQRTAAAKNR